MLRKEMEFLAELRAQIALRERRIFGDDTMTK